MVSRVCRNLKTYLTHFVSIMGYFFKNGNLQIVLKTKVFSDINTCFYQLLTPLNYESISVNSEFCPLRRKLEQLRMEHLSSVRRNDTATIFGKCWQFCSPNCYYLS